MNIFKSDKSKEEKIEYFNVTPQLKKAYGRNYRLLSEISKNTKAIENVAEQLEKLNKKIDKLTDILLDK